MNRKRRIYQLLLLNLIAFLGMLYIYDYNEQRRIEAELAAQVVDTPTSGEITVYTAYEDFANNYIQLFEEQYPEIKVNLVAQRTTTLTNQIFIERNNPQADVVWGLSSLRMLFIEWNDMLKGYTPTDFDLINPKFQPENTPPRWVGLDARMVAFCVNQAGLVERNLPIPQSWADLTNPAYTGEIVLSIPSSATSGYLVISTALQLYGETDGWDYLKEVDKNVNEYVDGGSASCKKVGAGDALIGVGFVYQMVGFKADGMPIEIIFPSEGVGWEHQVMGLINKKTIKQAAKTFVDWAITEAAMKQYAGNRAITGLQTDVPVPEGYPDNLSDHLLDQDFSWMTANRERVIRKWDETFSADLLAKD